MRLEWDARKGRENLRKHGVSFEEASSVFLDRKSTRLNSSHSQISYGAFCLKKKGPGGGRLHAAPRGLFRSAPGVSPGGGRRIRATSLHPRLSATVSRGEGRPIAADPRSR